MFGWAKCKSGVGFSRKSKKMESEQKRGCRLCLAMEEQHLVAMGEPSLAPASQQVASTARRQFLPLGRAAGACACAFGAAREAATETASLHQWCGLTVTLTLLVASC